MPEEPGHMWGEGHCFDHSIREENCNIGESYVIAWYDYKGTRYVYEDGGGLEGFWRAKPSDEVYLEAVQRAR